MGSARAVNGISDTDGGSTGDEGREATQCSKGGSTRPRFEGNRGSSQAASALTHSSSSGDG